MNPDDEILAALMRRILHDPERHEADDPMLWLNDGELVFDGRVSVTDAEADAIERVRDA